MNIIIDLDLQQAVQGFGSRQAALPIQVKSQDTPTVAVYFVRGNVTYDLGASPGLRFGVFVAGNPNALVQQNTFTRTTDNLARTVYVAYPNFNTVQMQAAIGSQPQISCIGEIRYQTTYGTIARTADVDFTVVRSLLTETVMDNLIAAFVTPAVNANVTARINNTGWLSAGLNISISGGAGAYQVVSVTNTTDFVAKNLGGTSNAVSGTTIPTGTAVGIAPVNVLQAYPDPSIIEVTTHKDVINGYAGLDGTGLLKGAEMPVDGTTIAVSGGKLTVVGGGGGAAGEDAYTTTSASFVVPAVGATVSVTLIDTDWMGGTGYVVFITGAGYYAVSSITDATHAVLTNVGGSSNAIAGTTVPTSATVTPGGPVGPAGAAGAPGAALSAYDALASSFVMPAVSGTVTITIGNTAWISANQIIYIATAGYFQVSAISSATQALITNLNYPGNATAATVIASGSRVSPGGLQGPQGAGGAGLNAFTTLSANFTQPAVNANVTVNVGSTAWMAVGQGIFIQGGGYYTVASISDLTHAAVTNLGGSSNVGAGLTVVGSGTQNVTPAGIPGTNGVNAYTVTTASFVTPASGSSVTMSAGNTSWATTGQTFYIAGAGYYQVAAILSATQFSITNLGYTGNAAGGTTVGAGASVSTSGPIGPAGSPGPTGAAGRDGAYSTVYAAQSIQGNGGVASNLTLVGDIAQASGAYKVYQRDSGGNSKWDVALLSAADAVSSPGTGEVSHIASTTSGVLALKKLKSGPAGSVALTDQGGSTGDILVDVPVDGTTIQVSGGRLTATGGGGGGFDPRGGVFAYDDFTTVTLAPNWQTPTSGVPNPANPVCNTTYGYDSTHKSQGVAELNTGVSTSGSYNGQTLLYGFGAAGGGSGSGIVLGSGTLDLVWRIALEEASLPPTGAGYIARMGLLYQSLVTSTNFPNGTVSGTSCVALEYSPDNNAGNFRIGYVFNSNAGMTYTNCSAGPTANTYGWWELKITSAGVCTAYFNGASIGSVTISSSLLGIILIPYFIFWRGTGSATNFHTAVDSFYLSYPYTR